MVGALSAQHQEAFLAPLQKRLAEQQRHESGQSIAEVRNDFIKQMSSLVQPMMLWRVWMPETLSFTIQPKRPWCLARACELWRLPIHK